MTVLQYTDHRRDPGAWARALGCSQEACELLLASDFVDLHCDTEVAIRVAGWDPARHHGVATRVWPLVGHVDFPRMREAGLTGVVWDLPSNPLRPARDRLRRTLTKVARAEARAAAFPDDLAVVRDHAGYVAARAAGKTALFVSLQGGNAVSADPSALSGPLRHLHRVTLVHLSHSDLGGTSRPGGADPGLTALGREVVARCNEARILVDLSHSSKATFWAALDAHTRDVSPIVSHTGVDGVRPHWRNLDDAQIRAIAERGGVVGIMYQSNFLDDVRWTCSRARIVDHLEHVIRVAGEDVPAIGTDYDGFIVPPHDLLDVTHHPLLVQDMLDRGWSHARIRGLLGANYLRVVQQTRPGPVAAGAA